jgi:hypothetical protein
MSNFYPSISAERRAEDFFLQIARGQVPGHTTVNIYGFQPLVSTTFIPIWENATAYTYPVAATQMHLAGTAGDTATITISGLDASYNTISENLALTGATPVTTVNSYLRVNSMVVAIGSATNPAGVVTLKNLTDTVTYAQINPGVGRTQAAIYTVPAGYTFYLSRIDINTSLNGNDYVTYQNKTTSPAGVVQLTQQAPFAINYHTQRVMPRPFAEKTDIQLMAKIQSGTGAVSISQEGILIKGASSGSPGTPWI